MNLKPVAFPIDGYVRERVVAEGIGERSVGDGIVFASWYDVVSTANDSDTMFVNVFLLLGGPKFGAGMGMGGELGAEAWPGSPTVHR